MKRKENLEERIDAIRLTLKIDKKHEKDIDKALEDWAVSKLKKQLQEKGWLKNEK